MKTFTKTTLEKEEINALRTIANVNCDYFILCETCPMQVRYLGNTVCLPRACELITDIKQVNESEGES